MLGRIKLGYVKLRRPNRAVGRQVKVAPQERDVKIRRLGLATWANLPRQPLRNRAQTSSDFQALGVGRQVKGQEPPPRKAIVGVSKQPESLRFILSGSKA